MADVKEEARIIKTTDKETLYAPKGAKNYKPGQETKIHPNQVDKFIKFGFAKTKDEALQNDAHSAIAEKPAVVDIPKGKSKGAPAADSTPAS